MAAIEQLGLSADVLEAILGGTAARLLGLGRRRVRSYSITGSLVRNDGRLRKFQPVIIRAAKKRAPATDVRWINDGSEKWLARQDVPVVRGLDTFWLHDPAE